MKIAELPNGKILRFEDELDDEYIDKAVAHEIKDSDESEKRISQRHADTVKIMIQIGQVLGEIYKQMHSHTQLFKELFQEQKKHHREINAQHDKLVKSVNAPRKRRVIRNEQGKLEGAEDYV